MMAATSCAPSADPSPAPDAAVVTNGCIVAITCADPALVAKLVDANRRTIAEYQAAAALHRAAG